MRCSRAATIIVLITCLLIAWPSTVIADLYEWQDEKGDMHVVDDPLLVPSKYRDKARVIKKRPPDRFNDDNSRNYQPAPQEMDNEQSDHEQSVGEELYGDHNLDWWVEQFRDLKNRIQNTEQTITRQKINMETFESGRRQYRIFDKADVDAYENNKKELPANEELLKKLKSGLEELRRRAVAAGVPREAREE